MQISTSASSAAVPRSVLCEPDALLRIKTVIALTGLCRASIYNKIRSGEFCLPVKLGPRCNRWRAGDVQAWLRAQTNGGDHA